MQIVSGSMVRFGGGSWHGGHGRLAHSAPRLALMAVALLLFAAPAAAAVSTTPAWELHTDGEVNDAVQVGDTVYLGGQFSYVGERTGPLVALSRTTGEKLDVLPEVVPLQGTSASG